MNILMFISRSINANHADLIHDIAYDFYGRRMATCSSDQIIKIWDLKDNGEWVCTASWRYHLGSVWRISWAHPEFGQVIATCSFDRTIAIWEEICGGQLTDPGLLKETDNVSTQHFSQQTGGSSWVRRAKLVDPRTSVTGLQFAPRHLGLQLAAISTDGMLRIYEALDVMNLSQWRLQFDFGTKMSGSCLAWSQSRMDPPLIAVGSANPSDSQFTNTSYDNSLNINSAISQSPLPSSNTNTNTTNNNITNMNNFNNLNNSINTGSNIGTVNSSNANANNNISSNNLNLQSTLMTNQSGNINPLLTKGKLILYEYSDVRRYWYLVEDVKALEDSVYDLSFAPHMGQSYHTLAIGSKEVYILRIKLNSLNQLPSGLTKSENSNSNAPFCLRSNNTYEIRLMARFDHHKGRVWRVSWNVTGQGSDFVIIVFDGNGILHLWL